MSENPSAATAAASLPRTSFGFGLTKSSQELYVSEETSGTPSDEKWLSQVSAAAGIAPNVKTNPAEKMALVKLRTVIVYSLFKDRIFRSCPWV
jgi:hypothetical protein